ncbi:mycothiol transferase [Candidatus Lucifugimonas marina]|uniref:DUF664 domain-containing protein n=1 Tax=Candidatus Lucifugimonas marina TaxID=3038979 RepID=A0AAJ5ZEX5_9CHLR|nr:DUF664 domain-containing protein [SAR202 cluster bacterium JH702]MDG0870183.1 DUF664 domain-containing protein [SAR202 cluster bacterium JH639]WFG36250.1 DUF664 domain-containing protein [SAR202 cluster bacterium JH545]WFG40197.1 DUF664 domain-containing protein [SAR202 cluster bacterium JH1073]
MESSDLLVEAYSHITRIVHQAADDLSQEQLAYRPEEGSNSIAWLVWHLTRIQDSHLKNVVQLEEAWLTEQWDERFGMAGSTGIGFGDGPEEVAAMRPPRAILLGYHDRVAGRVLDYLPTVDAEELDRIVDTNYDPHVKAGIRLMSVVQDNTQHAGQARYLRGMIDRLGV